MTIAGTSQKARGFPPRAFFMFFCGCGTCPMMMGETTHGVPGVTDSIVGFIIESGKSAVISL